MKFLLRLARRLLVVLLVVVLTLLAPSAYVELACRGEAVPQSASILPPEHRRAEARTLLTYPEWHIVHAYDDYARVIADGDPHDYGFFSAIGGFWSSFCALSERADAFGAEDGGSRQTVHVIGISFTAEMLMKALYEETLGRMAATTTEARRPIEEADATQMAEYATFLQQVPWYERDFGATVAALDAALGPDPTLRDRERRLALGLEYGVKARYARVIEAAVAGVGGDAPTLRLILHGITRTKALEWDGVRVLEMREEGLVLETPRYRELTDILAGLAFQGADFVEIAGNDDILFTTISRVPAEGPGIITSLPRQGRGDFRNLHLVFVPDLASHLRDLAENRLTLEHIHDY
ncbi:hypothetical protein MWU52_15450 [Jannaschia sp. S6380]|uniref:hypothetical protein n=1 Tax=Jannaschia sp. S6380 TaxID=2926408 RepID=UPI001FF4845B|nr:hypothetical protein [Jannaschia sp. S6380]MCK0168950.1 hypothetical protein [Jannaschia sp. S6380]